MRRSAFAILAHCQTVMQATQQLSLLLTHHVAHDTTLEATLPFVLRLLIEERLISQISLDSAENASVTLAKSVQLSGSL